MRLLNIKTTISSSTGTPNVPDYAILSHVWGSNEFLYSDIFKDEVSVPREKGVKVNRAAQFAREHGDTHLWIDTCCIDKSSSAEVSDTLNSMSDWYENATICFAYLADVTSRDDLEGSERFKRGWTLMELLAPKDVIFLDSDWNEIGARGSLANQLHKITNIDINILQKGQSAACAQSAATKFSWMAGRRCSRVEDVAYYLMGLFGVNMPILYGEGSEKRSSVSKKNS
ncbi:heterokaryon incompatibility protein-domain-containing protein [Podospora didyma]|uniref:Heterokaryon incompatibility protein-domain-containing protein n=1 Tax=Podospora didyma TaxID=330526 RepID=A0AAE0U2B3_9PEZI|nr:heterokaryon incompatibility protein-domain-containing protein [Podospora didyma]